MTVNAGNLSGAFTMNHPADLTGRNPSAAVNHPTYRHLNNCPQHPRGDMNCDGLVTQADLPLFVETLLNPSGGAACNFINGDVNGDGHIDGDDVPEMLATLFSQT